MGRIVEPWVAEEIIANGKADACMIGRANLCDPEFANKAKAGNVEDIRPCIGCLRCLNGIMFGKPVACTMNPSFALENEDTLQPSLMKKKILVIGAGPAGMEAAYVAKKRGHDVVLCEKEDDVGGALKAASVPIGKQDLCQVIKWMRHRLVQSGVDIRTKTMVTLEMLHNEFHDYEAIASTGAKAIIPQSMTSFKQWMTGDDILNGRAFPGRKIVIVGGGSVGCELADYLAPLVNDHFPRNRDITIIEMGQEVMLNESGPGRSLLVQRLMKKGVKMIVNAKVEQVTNNQITYVQNQQSYTIDDADTLVFACGYRPDSSIEDMLKQANITYHIIGDAHQVGNIKDAISEGYQVTKSI